MKWYRGIIWEPQGNHLEGKPKSHCYLGRTEVSGGKSSNQRGSAICRVLGNWYEDIVIPWNVGEKNRLRGSIERKVYRPSLDFLGKLSPSVVICFKP